MPIFERFLRYAWAEYALELAARGESPRLLRPWLLAQGLTGESARRTANILTHLWFPTQKNASLLREEALELLPAIPSAHRLALHWGMALVTFPSFRETVHIMGRLLRLQGSFSKAEVVARILERYSNQSTLKRAVERIFQSLHEWGVIHSADSRYTASAPYTMAGHPLVAWLYRAVLATDLESHWRVEDLLLANELFPFHIENSWLVLHHSPTLTIHRNAAGDETIGLRL